MIFYLYIASQEWRVDFTAPWIQTSIVTVDRYKSFQVNSLSYTDGASLMISIPQHVYSKRQHGKAVKMYPHPLPFHSNKLLFLSLQFYLVQETYFLLLRSPSFTLKQRY